MMTYRLHTLNRGDIEAGYLGVFVQNVNMGDFAVRTERFCHFVAQMATGMTDVGVPTTDGHEVKGSWDHARKTVRLGQYEISGREFGAFADYVFRGGLVGWKHDHPGWRPDFVNDATDYVRDYLRDTARKCSYLIEAKQNQLPSIEDCLK